MMYTAVPTFQLSILACRMTLWYDNHQVEIQHYAPDGRPVPHELALASRKVQLDSILDFLAQQTGDAQVLNAYHSSNGEVGDQLGVQELQDRFECLSSVRHHSASVFYFVDDPGVRLDRVLRDLRTAVVRLGATGAPHWLAIQAGPDRISTADLAELQHISDSRRWQLDAVWSTAPPGQCCIPMMEAGSDDTVQGVELYPYLLLALRCSAADHKAPSRQSSGARNELSPSGSAVSLCRHCHTFCFVSQAALLAVMVHTLARHWAISMMHHLMVPAGGQHRKTSQDPCQQHQAQVGEHQLPFAECQCGCYWNDGCN